MLKAWIWIQTHILGLIFAAAAIAIAIMLYQGRSDKDATAEQARLQQKAYSDSIVNDSLKRELALRSQQLNQANESAANILSRWQASLSRERALPALPPTASASDTAKRAIAQLSACRLIRDSLGFALDTLKSGCEQYRAKAESRIKSLERTVADLDSLNKAPRPQKRWGIGPAIGYGWTVRPANETAPGDGLKLDRRIFIGITIQRNIFSW